MFNVQVIAKGLADLSALGRLGLDLKYRAAKQVDRNRIVVPGIVTGDQIDKVKVAGYDVLILSDVSTVARERLGEVSEANRFAADLTVHEMAALTVGGYMTVEEIDTALENLVQLHPDLATIIELPNLTWEVRRSLAIRLAAGSKTDRVGVLFTGAMHAREWGGSDICVSFINNLIAVYLQKTPLQFGRKVFTAAQVTAMLENLNIYVFPDVNPDGKHYSQTRDPAHPENQNFWWRKNRNPNSLEDPRNPGVDLNRNFDFLWSSGIGTSDNPAQIIYKGTKAFSEPESKNVRHLFDTYPNITYYTDIHSYSGLILYSWGDDDNQSVDPSQTFLNPAYDGKRGILGDATYREYISHLDEIKAMGIANRMNAALSAVRGRNYKVEPGAGLYPTTATSSDYAFSRHQSDPSKPRIYGFTIEFGVEDFVPPFSEMQKIIQDVGAAMTELCSIACTHA
jgi:carboxypeptidase T